MVGRRPPRVAKWSHAALLLLAILVTWQIAAGEDALQLVSPPPSNVTLNETADPNALKEGSLAEIIDRVLEKEFPDQDPLEAAEGSNFNNTVNDQQAVLETVARVTSHTEKPHNNATSNETQTEEKVESGAQEVPILIDSKDNMFVMMNPRAGNMVLQQDLRLISDLVIVIVAAAIGGIVFASIGQPVITGYLLAGSTIGPGGLDLISELVQVETLAQFGVLFLLFALGMEFSASKLRAVRMVAIGGGLLQILLFLCLCGLTAKVCGGRVTEGVFVGALLSMSSTAVVLKCLMERGSLQSVHAQVTMGTLILQDCTVGLLFALLPVLGGSADIEQGTLAMVYVMLVLALFLAAAAAVGRFMVPELLKLLVRISAQTNELYQLTLVAFCLTISWVSDRLGLSIELGAFVAGVMISTTDLAEHTTQQVDPIRNLFGSLFLASIGMIMNPAFLWRHMDILLASVVLVVLAKTALITVVVRCFGYGMRTSLTVGISLAQIGEFAFVLLSRASNLHLVQRKLYLLLLGTTALSLVTTPLLFRLIPHIHRMGTVLGWFRGESDAPSDSKAPHLENKSDIEEEDVEAHETWRSLLDPEPLRQWYQNKVVRWFPRP